MADHIKINTGELANIGDALSRLIGEFQNSGNIADHYSGDLGSGRMADTLHEFATNWNVHKKNLLSNLGNLQSAAAEGAKTWDGVDSDLAKALTDPPKKG
jgi:hypothetical protein